MQKSQFLNLKQRKNNDPCIRDQPGMSSSIQFNLHSHIYKFLNIYLCISNAERGVGQTECHVLVQLPKPVTAREPGLGRAGTRSPELSLDLHVSGRASTTEPARAHRQGAGREAALGPKPRHCNVGGRAPGGDVTAFQIPPHAHPSPPRNSTTLCPGMLRSALKEKAHFLL